jgi:radical SAM protein with 4Fe4S-binding SPASM domain
MINLTKLLCGFSSYGDELRYKPNMNTEGRRPIVVWNTTRTCNLSCIHCYADSCNKRYPNELSRSEAKKMLGDLARFKVPVLLFSGGEPLLRKDIFQLNSFAKDLGLRTVLSTNGTLITKKLAGRIKEQRIDYVGVSLDGIGLRNDRFRGRHGAFNLALAGIRNLVDAGQKVGLRFTISRHNYPDLGLLFKLIEEENINRACFYHLVYAGRGSSMAQDDLSHIEMRRCIDAICDWVLKLNRKGPQKEVLTVDNHADGVYVYLKTKKQNPQKAKEILRLLAFNAGNSSGIGIANIDNEGFVHADQFWRSYSFGNVRERDFGEIWLDTKDKLMRSLKNRKPLLKGRCAQCKFLGICNGNFRVRAQAVYNDIWQEDPACYLTEEEIS